MNVNPFTVNQTGRLQKIGISDRLVNFGGSNCRLVTPGVEGFAVGNAVRNNGSAWVKAIADTEANTLGVGVVAALVPGEAYDALDSYTKLMLHCNGEDGSTTFTDYSPSARAVTAHSGAVVSTDQYALGNGSVRVGVSNAYLSAATSDDWDFGTDDFTIDLWIRFNTLPGSSDYAGILSASSSGGAGNWLFGIWNSKVNFSNGSQVLQYTHSFTTGVWYHLAVVRSSGTAYLYINGVEAASVAFAGDTNEDGNGIVAGRLYTASANYPIDAWLDEIRISKGVARWSDDFTVPTMEYGVTTAGFVVQKGGQLDGLSGLTPGSRYYLSDTTAGEITTTPPTIVVPILDAISASSADIVCR